MRDILDRLLRLLVTRVDDEDVEAAKSVSGRVTAEAGPSD
jgi:hypothetical protein